MQFRYDINNLRAYAVVGVLLYHINNSWLPGGFAGVDVFFVISGYLMTSIITNKLDRNKFSLLDFYTDRANRIIPPLLVLCLFMILAGWFYLAPLEYRSLAKHIVGSVTFISNIFYWGEAGYFTADSHEKWLLHTWSLSVEWQFYLIYPFLLVLMSRYFGQKLFRYLIIPLFVCLFIISLLKSTNNANSAFYLLQYRAWEMLLGGIAFLYPLRKKYNYMSPYLHYGGVCLILISFVALDGNKNWPSIWTVVPTLGTYLVIISNLNTGIITRLAPAQFLGKISYSLYLWHWPFVVLLYDTGYKLEKAIGVLILSVFLGWVSYELVEKVKRPCNINYLELVINKLTFATFFLAVAAVIVYMSNGADFQYRATANSLKSQYLEIYHKDNYRTPQFDFEYRKECNYFDPDSFKAITGDIPDYCTNAIGNGGVFLWGDSHAQALSHGIRNFIGVTKPFYQVASSGCRPLIEKETLTSGESKKSCDRSNKKAYESIIEINPSLIVWAQHNFHDKNDFLKIANSLRQHGVTAQFVLVGPVPQWRPSLPKAIAKRHFEFDKIRILDTSFDESLLELDQKLKSKYKGTIVEYISLIGNLCNEQGCIAKVDDANTPLVWDYGHLTLKGSRYVIDNIVSKNRVFNDENRQITDY